MCQRNYKGLVKNNWKVLYCYKNIIKLSQVLYYRQELIKIVMLKSDKSSANVLLINKWLLLLSDWRVWASNLRVEHRKGDDIDRRSWR